MGVKGLLSLLSKFTDFHELFLETIPRESILLIDGNNFMFYLMGLYINNTSTTTTDEQIDRRYGGSYEEFREIILREFNYLCYELGFQLEVYFDGYDDHHVHTFKGSVIEEREKYRIKSWENLYKMLLYRSKVINQDSLPLPPLTRFLLEFYLKRDVISRERSIRFIQCRGEADIDMGKRCQELNHLYEQYQQSKGEKGSAVTSSLPPRRAFIYSDDSDFFVMKNTPTIKFESFSLHYMEIRSNPSSLCCHKSSASYSVEVWHRAKIAQLLGFHEEQFMNFCIFVGCDFTKTFSRSDFSLTDKNDCHKTSDEIPNFRRGGSPFLVCKIYDYIKGELGDEFALSALKEHPSLQEAIDYSRKFYQLELKDEEYDAEKHQDGDQEREEDEEEDDDVDKTSEEVESEESEESTVTSSEGTQYGLDEGSVELLKESFVTYLLSSHHKIHFNEVPHLIVKFMKDFLETSNTSETNDPATSEEAEPLFEEIHVKAIDQMIKLLEEKDLQQRANLKKDDEEFGEKKQDAAGVKDGKFVLEPVWNDILIGKLYQELLLLGIKKTIDYPIFKSSTPSNFSQLLNYPTHFYYDGRTFHQIIYEIRQRELYDPEEYQEEEEKEEEGGGEENTEEDDEEKNLIESVKDSLKINKEDADTSTSNNSPLPVDIHEENILKQLNSSHFLIIQGETGCGKSTRIPVMIMEEAKRKKQHCQILVCEPHRAATQGLYNRVQSLCPNEEIGLRLGLNERKGSNNSKIIFATAGYVFHRYINAIDDLTPFTHIVIDEIHERSVENDLVCYIAKQLFNNKGIKPQLKVVLMSATVDASIFSDYFMGTSTVKHSSEGEENEKNPFALWVGTHPHPTTTYYIEDLGNNPELKESLQPVYSQDFFLKRDEIIDYCSNKRDLSNTFFKKQLEVAKDLILQCAIGSSVLIFVSGMSDIQYFEEELKYSKKFQIYPIHSELDRVEEEKALQELTPELKSSIVRVVVATNAAESSITIPDLSIVIDLGTNNREIHDSSNFSRTMIKTTWISKPSAKQRAGRTGRVGPGKVFRLYTKEQYETFSNMIEPEIIKKPLHDVVLRVLGSLSGHFHPQTRTNQPGNPKIEDKSKKTASVPLPPPVTIPPLATVADLLLSFVASPITSPTDPRLIDSLIYLSRNYMITTIPSNLEQVTKCPICHLTPLGRFASEMPLSSHFSRVIVYAQLLGLGGYGIILAAILSEQSFRPFKYKRVVYAHPDDFNDSIRDIFLAMNEIDDNRHIYSEPILLMMLYLLWVKDEQSAVTHYSLEKKKMDKLHKMIDVYMSRMNLFLDSFQLNLKRVDLKELTDRITPEDIQLLRIILVWISDGNILRLASPDPHHSLVINQLSSSETKTPLYLQKDFFRDTLINHVNTLTERRVRQLFPPRDIPSSLPTLPKGREYGYVKVYNIQKGFGFIAPYDPTSNYQGNNYDTRPKDLFVHRTKIFKKGKAFLRAGEIVEFTRSVDQEDSTKFFATDVTALGGGHIVSVSSNYRIPATIQSIDRKIFNVKMRSLKALKLSPAQSTTPITLTSFQFQSRILQGVPGTTVARSPSDVEAVWSWTRFPEAISGVHSMAVFVVKGATPDRLSELRTVLMNAMIHDSRPAHRGSHYIEEEDTMEEGKREKADEEATNPPTAQFVSLQEIHTRLGLSDVSLQEVSRPSSVEFITIINPPLSGNHLIRQILLLYSSGIEFFFSDRFIGRLESEFTFRTYNNIPLDPIPFLGLLNPLINHQIDPTKTVSYERRPFLRIQYHQSSGSDESKEFKDLPIGMRLLNAYCAHQRYRCLTVGNIDYRPENETQHHQWYEISLPRQTNLHGYYAKWELLQSKLAIDTSTPSFDQKKEEGETTAAPKPVVTSFEEEEWSRAKIDYYSYLAYSYPQFKDPAREGPVYAVANAVLISQRGEDRVNINCDQVTFLPYDERALLLIMVSISQRWMTYVRGFPDNDSAKQQANNIRQIFEDMVYNRDSPILLFREDSRFRAAVLRLLRHLVKGENEVEASLPRPATGRGGPSNFGRGSSNTRSNHSDRGDDNQGYQRRPTSSYSRRGNDEGRSHGYGYQGGDPGRGLSTNNRWDQSDRGSDRRDYQRQANSSYSSERGSEERYQGGYRVRQQNDRIDQGINHNYRQGYGRENEYRGEQGRGYQGRYQRNSQGSAGRGYGVHSQQQPPQTRPMPQRESNGGTRTSHNRYHDEYDEDEDRNYQNYDYDDYDDYDN